ncbi:venom allergen 3-like isoform X3 [Temnothorax curvispinosus]|uniref:Venom allergen 3-like isoform X3 n=1 Tax=Temnothorax curvispinosus TaxID=300111 RepID=A0A6J1PC40_9HYME|nr:venom allergen 3-like isoform X3 [Temnothorax curvispinosus]
MTLTERNASLFLLIVTCLLVNHCQTSCIGKTMLRSGGISCEEKQIILDEHNRLRQLVALGQIHGQPGAANMMEMIWDDELAAIAQRWADHCAESHDSLRNVRRFAVGQNIARSWTTRPPGPYDGEPNWRRQISGWFNEVQYYHSGYSKITGHYTQLVWGDTFLLGCGYSFYYDPARGYTKNYVCNYGPSSWKLLLFGSSMCIWII